MEEIFVLWQPVLVPINQERSNLTCLLAPLSTLAPIFSVELPEYLLWRLNIKGNIISWQIESCLTDYTTPPEDIGSEKTKWCKAWILNIEIENATTTNLVLKHESFFIKDGSISRNEVSQVDQTPTYLIIADFSNEEDRSAYLESVCELLAASGFEMMMAELSGINLSVFQMRLQIEAEYCEIALRVEELCLEHGGFTNFVQRIDATEEIYNPDGIE